MQWKPTIFLKYALRLKKTVYQDGNVRNGNIAGYINSSIGREEEANVHWAYVSLPAPWNPKVWKYAMTVATRDIDGRRRGALHILSSKLNEFCCWQYCTTLVLYVI